MPPLSDAAGGWFNPRTPTGSRDSFSKGPSDAECRPILHGFARSGSPS